MFYDYFGFLPAAYEINYPASGHLQLANQIFIFLGEAGIAARVDVHFGVDHSLFIPLNLMDPQANMPALQLSLINALSL